MQRNRAVVIGAGVGGLVAAAELAAAGFTVTVLERSAVPGGKLHAQHIAGRRIDVGPTVLTMREVFDDLFYRLGDRLENHVKLQAANVLARHAWSADERLDLHADRERTLDAVGAFAGRDEARRYAAFCAHAREIFTTLDRPFMRAPNPSLLRLLTSGGVSQLARLTRIESFTTLWQALGRHFKDERLRQLFARYATYCGSSPYSAPGTLMLVAHAELSGVWCIEDGLYGLALALVELGRRHGVSHRYDVEVSEVTRGARGIDGVRLADGERIEADVVVCNADAAAVAGGLFGADVQRAVPPLATPQRSLSALTLALCARTEGFSLAHHNVFFSTDYAREFDEILGRRRLPSAPTVYVCAQDRGEHAVPPAPGGIERLFCIINAPPDGDRWLLNDADVARCRDAAFARLAQCGLSVQHEPEALMTATPVDYERRFPASGGGLYGRSSHGWRASFARPGVRSPIPGLYFAGGSVHPGAGLPMVALSGRLAAGCALADRRRAHGRGFFGQISHVTR